MSFRKLFLQTFGAICIILSGIATFVWLIDPYQHYRADDIYIGNQRLEIPGVARHHKYDAVILGSSMCMNHYPTQVDSLFGWHTYNFTFMGANSYDYKIALPMILGQHKVRHIIWGLDVFSFTKSAKLIEPYLYDDNVWNDIAYLLNYTSIKYCFYKLFRPVHIDNIYHFNYPANADAFRQSYAAAKQSYFTEEQYDYEAMCELFDNDVNIPHLYKDVDDVIIYFPPYSIGEFLLLRDYGYLETYIKFKRYIIEQLLKWNNVRIYDFQVADWITNIDEYMDLRHHSHNYNRRIIECIYNNQYELSDNYWEQLDEFVRMIEDYDDSQLVGIQNE